MDIQYNTMIVIILMRMQLSLLKQLLTCIVVRRKSSQLPLYSVEEDLRFGENCSGLAPLSLLHSVPHLQHHVQQHQQLVQHCEQHHTILVPYLLQVDLSLQVPDHLTTLQGL